MVSLKQYPGGHTFEDIRNVEKFWHVADNKGHRRVLAEIVKAKHDTRIAWFVAETTWKWSGLVVQLGLHLDYAS
jgi:hypothetical protein